MNESQIYSPIRRFVGPATVRGLLDAQFRLGHCQLQHKARGRDQQGKGNKADGPAEGLLGQAQGGFKD